MTMSKLSAIMLTWGGGQILCYVLDGMVLGGSGGMLEVLLRSSLGFNISSANGFNLIMLPVAFLNFLSNVFFWSFSFLDGNMLIVRVFLFLVITIPGFYGLWQGLRGS